jgi:hypothetical protein
MDSVPYRNTKLLVQTIPKGTLLFRLTKTPDNDLRGVPINETTRCISPNFNVFFHPNPFIGYHMYKDYLNEIGKTVHIYVLNHDIKVLLLTNPSPYSRLDRKGKRTFVKRCSTVRKGCMPTKGKSYDPCLSDTIISKFPSIVGMLAIASGDVKYLKRALKRGIKQKTLRTFHKVKDSSGVESVPELILHPLTTRPSQDVLVNEDTQLDNNYSLLKSVPYNETELHAFMDSHAVFDPNTNFYVYKE